MNKDIKGMLKDAAILLAITFVAGLVLGVVYNITKDPIALQQAKQKNSACQEVFAQASSFDVVDGFDATAATAVVSGEYAKQTIDEVLEAKDASGAVLGYVVTVTTNEAYDKGIQFLMGISNEGVLNGISILSISESPGLGMRADEVLKPQFAGKQVDKFEYTKTGATAENQIDAISGATITTNAVTNGVNAGLLYFQKALGGGANE